MSGRRGRRTNANQKHRQIERGGGFKEGKRQQEEGGKCVSMMGILVV